MSYLLPQVTKRAIKYLMEDYERDLKVREDTRFRLNKKLESFDEIY